MKQVVIAEISPVEQSVFSPLSGSRCTVSMTHVSEQDVSFDTCHVWIMVHACSQAVVALLGPLCKDGECDS